MDNPSCPKCGHYNAMLRSGDFVICRDCGFLDENQPDFRIDIKRRVLAVVTSRTRSGVGIRTTEAENLYRLAVVGPGPSAGYNDGSDAAREWYKHRPRTGLMTSVLLELRDQGYIKFVTEGSYCWIVPADWKDAPRVGYIHVQKREVPEPFDLFGC